LRTNGCMDQDATWYGGRPRSRRLCVRWGSSTLPKKGAEPPPQLSAHCCCGPKRLDASRCHKMPFVVLPQPRGLCVRCEPSLPLQKGDGAAQIFGACLLWPNAWMDQDGTWHVSRPRPRRHCVRWEPISPSPKTGGALPHSPIFAPCLLWPNGWMDQDGTWNGSDAKNRIRLYTA